MEGSTPIKSPPIQKWGMAIPCLGIAPPGPPEHLTGVTAVTGSILEMHILDCPHLKSNVGRPTQHRNPSCWAGGRNWMLHVHTAARKKLKKTHILPLGCKFSTGHNQIDLQSLLLFCPFLQSLVGFHLSTKAQIWRCSPTLM